MKPANELLSGIGTTVFTVMSALAAQHGSINLGQGFPDSDGPPTCWPPPPPPCMTAATSIRR